MRWEQDLALLPRRRAARAWTLLATALSLTLAADAYSEGRTWHVNQKHPNAADAVPEGEPADLAGTEGRPFRTIQAAANRAAPGDTVLVHPGLYRECVRPLTGGLPGKPVIYAGATDPLATGTVERAVLTGAELWRPDWRNVPGHARVLEADLPAKLFPAENPFLQVAHPKRGGGRYGQVFADGALLREAPTLDEVCRTPGTWCVAGTNPVITLHVPTNAASPAACRLEITVRPQVFVPQTRGLGYVHVRNLVFEAACNRVALPSYGMVSTASGHHWVIERNVFRFAKGIALEIGNEAGVPQTDRRPLMDRAGYHVVRNNLVADNAQCGIAGCGSTATRIVGNTVERNGWGVIGAESGGIKLHWLWDGVVEGNRVRDNGGWGIWIDHGIEGARVTRNVVLRNGCGIFLELSDDTTGRALVDRNIVAGSRNDGAYGGIYGHGDGIYTHDASDVWVLHNLVFDNQGFGVRMRIDSDRRYASRTAPEMRLASCSRQRVLRNLILGNGLGAVALAFPGVRAEGNLSDYNVFDATDGTTPRFLFDTGNGDRRTAEQIGRTIGESLGLPAPPPVPLRTRWLEKNGWVEQTPEIGVRMDLASWRRFATNDAHSVVCPRLRAALSEAGDLTLTADEALWSLPSVPPELLTPRNPLPVGRALPALDRDFSLSPLPADPLPGPFQNLKRGHNVFALWPVALPADPPPETFLDVRGEILHP